MRKLILTLAAILTMNSSAYAFDEWTKTDTALQLAYAAVHIADWSQTRWISTHPYEYESFSRTNSDGTASFGYRVKENKETNPILGEHPHKDEVDIYFASTLLLHSAIAYALPKPYRTYWQAVTLTWESSVVYRNYRAGISVKF